MAIWYCSTHGGKLVTSGMQSPNQYSYCDKRASSNGSTACHFSASPNGSGGTTSFVAADNSNPSGGTSGSGGGNDVGLLANYKVYWYNDDGSLLKVLDDVNDLSKAVNPTGMESKLISSSLGPVFRGWLLDYTSSRGLYTGIYYLTATYVATKIAIDTEMALIGKSALAAPTYRALKLSELGTCNCKLVDSPSLTYASNQCVRYGDITSALTLELLKKSNYMLLINNNLLKPDLSSLYTQSLLNTIISQSKFKYALYVGDYSSYTKVSDSDVKVTAYDLSSGSATTDKFNFGAYTSSDVTLSGGNYFIKMTIGNYEISSNAIYIGTLTTQTITKVVRLSGSGETQLTSLGLQYLSKDSQTISIEIPYGASNITFSHTGSNNIQSEITTKPSGLASVDDQVVVNVSPNAALIGTNVYTITAAHCVEGGHGVTTSGGGGGDASEYYGEVYGLFGGEFDGDVTITITYNITV